MAKEATKKKTSLSCDPIMCHVLCHEVLIMPVCCDQATLGVTDPQHCSYSFFETYLTVEWQINRL